MTKPTIPPEAFQQALLAWYQQAARPLPWRSYENPNPYRIWLAEIMLQQTTVATVIPYYHRFLENFPTVEALANAPLESVLTHWQGLGYYRRAHLLHACAKTVTTQHAGHFPTTEAELLTLPGLGPYTAAAVAAMAFNQPASVVDGNVERVISRLSQIETPLPTSKPQVKSLAANLASPTSSRSYANAIMELGATICTPKNPQCPTCPVNQFCQAFQSGSDVTIYPRKLKTKTIPHKHATAYLLTDPTGALYLHQRPATGLLASLWEVPHTGWESTPLPFAIPTNSNLAGTIKHTFTHFHLTISVHTATTSTTHPKPNAFAPEALPPLSTLMKKVLQAADSSQLTLPELS